MFNKSDDFLASNNLTITITLITPKYSSIKDKISFRNLSLFDSSLAESNESKMSILLLDKLLHLPIHSMKDPS